MKKRHSENMHTQLKYTVSTLVMKFCANICVITYHLRDIFKLFLETFPSMKLSPRYVTDVHLVTLRWL